MRQDAPEVRTVPSVNLERYAGEWHEAARLPNRFQEKCAGDGRATYARHSDGRIDVINRCSPDRKYLWILSRTAVMDAAQLDAAIAVARAQGFDAGALLRAR